MLVRQSTPDDRQRHQAKYRRPSKTRAARLGMIVMLPALLAVAGCAKKETFVEVFPVSGTVKVDGKAPEGARVVLSPVNPSGPDAITPNGAVKSDGSFTVTTYKAGDGAPPGEYVVTVVWFKYDESIQGTGPNVLPEQYASPKTSPIKATVAAGVPTVIDPIVIRAGEKTARAGAAARK